MKNAHAYHEYNAPSIKIYAGCFVKFVVFLVLAKDPKGSSKVEIRVMLECKTPDEKIFNFLTYL
jgi:hypothetical protein